VFSRRRRYMLLGATLAALTASVALAATQQTYSQKFSVKKPGQSTGMTFKSSTHDPSAPGGVATAVRTVTLTLPAGAKINNGAVAKCVNPPSCPAKSKVGSGSATSNVAGNAVPTSVVAYNRAGGLVLVIANPLGAPIVLQPSLAGGKLTLTLPDLSFGVVKIVVTDLSLTINKIGSGKKAFTTTPRTCPKSHAWLFQGAFSYADGTRKSLTAKSACTSR
jgi:hypothetical protein